MEDEEGAIIFLDQQKAFDRVEWGWIDLCFEKFGFSDCFRGWVKMLFKNAKNKCSDEQICIPLRQHFTFNPSRVPNRSDAIHFAGGAIGGIH